MTGAAGALALVMSVGLLCAGRVATALGLCAVQALCAAVCLAGVTINVAVAAIILNGVTLPLAVARLAGTGPLRGHAWIGWVVALVIPAVTAGLLAGPVAAGVSVTLLGLVFGALRRHPLAPAVGLLSAQNGLVLLAGADPALSLPASVAVAAPLLPALALADHWLRR